MYIMHITIAPPAWQKIKMGKKKPGQIPSLPLALETWRNHSTLLTPVSSLAKQVQKTNFIILRWGLKSDEVKVLVTWLCPTLWDPMDFSPPGSTVNGIFQARILEWEAIPFSRGFSQLRDWIQVSCIAGRFFTIWATREALCCTLNSQSRVRQSLLSRSCSLTGEIWT